MPGIAKIETPQAIDHLDEILVAAEGVMVARGGLGIEDALGMTPTRQKHLIERGSRAGKLVISATQLMGSITGNFLPTGFVRSMARSTNSPLPCSAVSNRPSGVNQKGAPQTNTSLLAFSDKSIQNQFEKSPVVFVAINPIMYSTVASRTKGNDVFRSIGTFIPKRF